MKQYIYEIGQLRKQIFNPISLNLILIKYFKYPQLSQIKNKRFLLFNEKNMNKVDTDFYLFTDYFQEVLYISSNDVNDWPQLQSIMMKRVSHKDFLIYSHEETYQKILIHTLKVLHCVQMDDRFKKASQRSQQILLWTSLFHDCAKLAPPEIKSIDCRDPAHPFRSCYRTLHYLQKLNLLSLTKAQIELWDHLFQNAYLNKEEKQNEGKIAMVQTHNMSMMPKIVLFLEKQLNSSFFCTILKLICLHQCIPCNKYPPVSPINLKETSLFFNEYELNLLEIFWHNDSYSYVYFETNKTFDFGDEIHEKMQDAFNHIHSCSNNLKSTK